MKIGNIRQLNGFIGALNECTGQVWLESPEGDRYNLRSSFNQYIAFGKLLDERGDLLELFCSDKNDERLFLQYFHEHPEVLDINVNKEN